MAGIQLEFEQGLLVRKALDTLYAQHPNAELLVLGEYTFDGFVPRPGNI